MKTNYLCIIGLALLAACVAPSDVGTFKMPLVASGSSGTTYRLRNAVFVVRDESGGEIVSLAGGGTEDELTRELVPGSYTVTIEGNWTLRDETAAVNVDAVLVSNPVQALTIAAGEITDVVYQFSLAHDAVSFGYGRVDIGIAVEEPRELVDVTFSWTMAGEAATPTTCDEITAITLFASPVDGPSISIPRVSCWAGSVTASIPAGDYRTITFIAAHSGGQYARFLDGLTFTPDGVTSATADFPFTKPQGTVSARFSVNGSPWTSPDCDAGGDLTAVGPVVETSTYFGCGTVASSAFVIIPPGDYTLSARRFAPNGAVLGTQTMPVTVESDVRIEVTFDFPL